MKTRRPIRANQWYEGDPIKLAKSVEETLQAAEKKTVAYKSQYPTPAGTATFQADTDHLAGLLGPHAGLSYCGVTSGCAYAKLRSYLYRPTKDGGVEGDKVKRILLLGPSHAKYFNGVMLPAACSYGTPLGDLTVDTACQKEMESRCSSNGVPTCWMTQKEDEAEHSLELHTPYIAHVLHGGSDGKGGGGGGKRSLSHIQIVPMVVGDMDTQMESNFGLCLKPFLAGGTPSGTPGGDTLFIVSSDFCHWGERFRYQHVYDKKGGSPGDAIERMDHAAVSLIQQGDTSQWATYLRQTGNTICGRHVISSFLFAAIDSSSKNSSGGGSHITTEFLHYSQSNRCESPNDSSVSYASAVFARK